MTRQTSSVDACRNQAEKVSQFVSTISDGDIRLLRIFCVVVSAGGLSAATAELQADLSTVSRQIKELEDMVGARLCNRGRSGFSLTAHGALVHAAAQELLKALKAFRENIDALHTDPVGELRLGVMDALITDPQFPLAAAMRAYRARAPRVRITLAVSQPMDIERMILQGELDAGVVAAREPMPGLHYHPLYKERSNLYCASPHPWFDRDDPEVRVGDSDLLDLVEDPYTDSVPIPGYSSVFRHAARADSLEGVALLVKSGDYVGFLPDHYAAMLNQGTALRAIRPDLFSYEQGIDLVWRSGPMNAFVKGLFSELRIGKLPGTMAGKRR
jgi:DNA-binding transcriptional LysR family regulator